MARPKLRGLWLRGSVYWCNLTINGQRVREPLHTNRETAERLLAEKIVQKQSAKYRVPGKNVTFEIFLREYMAWAKSKPSRTLKRDRAAINSLLKFKFIRSLSEIDVAMLDQWTASRVVNGTGAATINRDLGAIRTMLRTAVSWGYCSQLEWNRVKKQKELRSRPKFYTVDQLRKLLDESGSWKTVTMLGARAGLRRSEMFYLAWTDIDFKNRMVTIQAKEGWIPKGASSQNPKIRDIPMSDDLFEHLNKIPKRGSWVLMPRPNTTDVMTSYYRKVTKRTGLPGGLHWLRHTFCSHLAQDGVDIRTIADLAGHSDIRETMRYAHLLPNNLRAAVRRLPKL